MVSRGVVAKFSAPCGAPRDAVGEASAIGDELRFATPMFGCRIEAQRPRGCVEFGDQLVELLVARPETFVPPEVPFAAVDDAYPLAAMAAERPVLDEPKAIGPHVAHLNSDQDPPFLNRTCAKPISFCLSPTWMIACGASSCTTPIARRRGILMHSNSSKKRR
jgi:hypothetical protein